MRSSIPTIVRKTEGLLLIEESQSLLNEVKYSNVSREEGEEKKIKSQSLLNEVKYSNLFKENWFRGGGCVAIPFKWGQVSYSGTELIVEKANRSQSLLNEVKFPTQI